MASQNPTNDLGAQNKSILATDGETNSETRRIHSRTRGTVNATVVEIVDATGNQITSFGSSTVTANQGTSPWVVDTELPAAAALADGVSSTNVEPRVAADMQGIRPDNSANSDRAVLSKMQDLNSGAGTEMVVGVTIRKAGPSGSLPDDGYPSGAVAVTSASGNKANAAGTATLTAGASTTAYISGFECTSTGATVGLPVIVTVTGTISGTLSYIFAAPAGALLIATPLQVQFFPPIPASAVNTNIVVTLPALGAGNTNAAVVAHGYIL